jgi:DNA-directed RNA polymerase subunit RPC12/RpoP
MQIDCVVAFQICIKYYTMSLIKLLQKFPDNDACQEHFRLKREKEGVICKKCSSLSHYWLRNKNQWQCKSCGFRTTIKSGTIMEDSKMSIFKWYMAIAFMTDLKKGVSAKELQRQLGQKRYYSIWCLMHKIRHAMGTRDAKYILKGELELDEGYYTVATDELTKQNTKQGRGSKTVVNVACAAESTPLEDIETGKKSSKSRYYKMKALETHKAEEINKFVSENIDEKCIVFSDKSTSYTNLEDIVEMHCVEISSKELTTTTLKWVHIAISNSKRNFLGVYHHIKGKYLQNYLNEFCYKLNRRYFGYKIFERATLAVASTIR